MLGLVTWKVGLRGVERVCAIARSDEYHRNGLVAPQEGFVLVPVTMVKNRNVDFVLHILACRDPTLIA